MTNYTQTFDISFSNTR